MGGGHGGGRGVEVDGLAPGGNGAVEYGLREGATQAKAAPVGADPQALQFPGVGREGGLSGQGAPGDEAGRLTVRPGDEAATALLVKAERQALGLFLQQAKTEAGCAGLCGYKSTVFEQQLAGLGERMLRCVCGKLFNTSERGIAVGIEHS